MLSASAAALALVWLAWWSLLAGASRLIADYAARARAPEAAELAVRLTPSDPEGFYARAGVLAESGDLTGAARAYERAIRLRPRDHVLWLELGKARERLGDAEGALAAFREAARLAPHYAQPRWQAGNALLRAGQTEAAFAELRRAAESDPALYTNLLQTIWHASGKNAEALASAAPPRTAPQALEVVRLLLRSGAGGAALRALREWGAGVPAEARPALVADFIAAEEFAAAYEVWAAGRAGAGGRGSFDDGGFESAGRSEGEGFGWRFAGGGRGVNFSLDADAPREGARSLKVEYGGNSEPSAAAVSQLVAVEPGARYRLTFSARTKELVTGGPPFVQVVSAAKTGEALADAPPLSATTAGWQDFSLEFDAPAAGAVRVALRRRRCATSPCPAFGGVWLDAFALKRL